MDYDSSDLVTLYSLGVMWHVFAESLACDAGSVSSTLFDEGTAWEYSVWKGSHGGIGLDVLLASAVASALEMRGLDSLAGFARHAASHGFHEGYGWEWSSNSFRFRCDPGAVAGFISEYSMVLAIAASISRCRSPACLAHLAYLLLEPVSRRILGGMGGLLDLVLDRVDIALSRVVYEGLQGVDRGCVVRVRLDGAGEWIWDSRDPGEWWASRWLAGLLAWKSVELLVDRYGPGVLAWPPARRHPLYVSRHLGPVLDKVSKSIPGLEWLWEASGLPDRWPVEPAPWELLAVVPGWECRDLGELAAYGFRTAWSNVVDGVLGSAGVGRGLRGLVSGLAAPFGLVLEDARRGTVIARVSKDEIGGLAGSGGACSVCGRSPIIIDRLCLGCLVRRLLPYAVVYGRGEIPFAKRLTSIVMSERAGKRVLTGLW